MQQFKIDHFLRDNQGTSFPWFRTLTLDECKVVQSHFAEALGLPLDANYSAICQQLDCVLQSKAHRKLNGKFNIAPFLLSSECRPMTVLIDWSTYGATMTDVDEFRLDDFEKHFDDIVYAVSDDIFLISKDAAIVIMITHSGSAVRLV